MNPANKETSMSTPGAVAAGGRDDKLSATADIIKKAMINVHRCLAREKLQAKIDAATAEATTGPEFPVA